MMMVESLSLEPATVVALAGEGLRVHLFPETYALGAEDSSPCGNTSVDLWRCIATSIFRVEAPTQEYAWAARFFWVWIDSHRVSGRHIVVAIGGTRCCLHCDRTSLDVHQGWHRCAECGYIKC